MWKRIASERDREGDYIFSGSWNMTVGISEVLEETDILNIKMQIQEAVKRHEGIDYLQVFSSDDGKEIWVIDNLTKTSLESGAFSDTMLKEHNHVMILLPSEY